MTDSHNLKQMKGKYSSILNFEMPDTYVYKMIQRQNMKSNLDLLETIAMQIYHWMEQR